MKIPQVNQDVTDRNREQTKRVLQLLGLETYTPEGNDISGRPFKIAFLEAPPSEEHHSVFLPNQSFTLDQVVGMLEYENVFYRGTYSPVGWHRIEENQAPNFRTLIEAAFTSHNLTAAMDALIKVLEEKK